MRRGWPSEAVEKRYVLARALSPNISIVRSAPVLFKQKHALRAICVASRVLGAGEPNGRRRSRGTRSSRQYNRLTYGTLWCFLKK